MENNSLYLDNKLSFAYKLNRQKGGLAACGLVVVAALLLFLAGILWWPHPLLYQYLPALFLFGGVAHTYLLEKNLPSFSLLARWLFTGLLVVMIVVVLGLFAIWDNKLSLPGVLISAGAFLVPFSLSELWQAYADISFSHVKCWQLSAEGTDDLPAIYLKSIKIRFKVIQEPAVDGPVIIPVTASARMPLSVVFFAMVQKQNNSGTGTIAMRSRELEPFTWVFYKMDGQLWYRPLDPEKSLQDNGIGKNSLIYVQRVSEDAFGTASNNDTKLHQA